MQTVFRLTAATCVLFGSFVQAADNVFDIPSQSLSQALVKFSEQADTVVMAPQKLLDGKKASQVQGTMSAQEALKKLLEGTGLEATESDRGSVAIHEAQTSTGDARQSSLMIQLAQSEAASTAVIGDGDENGEKGRRISDGSVGAEKLEEVVVTAQRRAQNLQDVPIAMSVLSGKQLDIVTTGVSDQLRTVPGVANLHIQGNTDATLLSIRGVTTSNPQFGGASVVGYYLDSVPFGFMRQSFLPDPSAYDLDRVEVLRGPQGTLYGTNSLNGVVRVLTHTPDLDEVEAKARVATSAVENGGIGYRADGALNIPIAPGKFAARAVVGYENSAGWVDAPAYGGEDINDRQSTSARLRLAAAPSDNLNLGFMIWHAKSSADAFDKSLPNRTITTPRPDLTDSVLDVYALDVRYDFAQFAFTSTTSYMDYGTDVNAMPLAPITATSNILESFFDSNVFSQEISLDSTGEGPWQWSLGGIYREVEDHVQQNLRRVVTGLPAFGNPDGFGYTDISNSYAVFGEVTRSFNDGTFDITAGLRYFKDEQELHETDVLASPTAPLTHSESEFDSVTPRVVFNWRPNDDLTVYASYAQGFRSGLAQSPNVLAVAPTMSAIKPDTLTSYEVGAKGDAFDGFLSFDSAIFFINWQDVQTPLRVPIPGTTSGLSALINADEAEGMGAEAAVTLRPTDGLSVTLNGGWNDLAFTSDLVAAAGTPVIPVVVVAEGERLPVSPEWTANFIAEYRFPVGALEGNIAAGVSYVSELSFYTLSGTTVTTTRSEESTISRLEIGLHAPDRWGVTFSIENLTDENGIVDPVFTPVATGATALRPQPRTFVLQLNYNF